MATNGTYAQGISGNNIVGHYDDTSGTYNFLYNDSTNAWMTLDDPFGANTSWHVDGISGNIIVGSYTDSGGVTHGFATTVPEPAALSLLPPAAVALLARRRRVPR